MYNVIQSIDAADNKHEEDKVDRRGLNMLWKNECVSVEKQRGLQFIMCYFKKK